MSVVAATIPKTLVKHDLHFVKGSRLLRYDKNWQTKRETYTSNTHKGRQVMSKKVKLMTLMKKCEKRKDRNFINVDS